MSDFDLLRAVQPDEGWYALVGISSTGRVKQELLETREEVDRQSAKLAEEGWNVFFGVAKFKDDSSRKKDNVAGLKALWVDIDCGETKAAVNPATNRPDGYATQGAGAKALQQFCANTGLPAPILVNSGRGLHAYWPLTEGVSREKWEPVAHALRLATINHDFYVDLSCFEAARILRVPGTYNFKDRTPREVQLLAEAQAHPLSLFEEILKSEVSSLAIAKPSWADGGLSPMAQQLQANFAHEFGKIMRRGEDGCRQLAECYRNRATLSEPLWFAALSVAKFCSDKDFAMRKLSEGHPDYDPESAARKMETANGPHKCVTFEAKNPGGCKGCAHKGKITSPIVLGRELKTSKLTIAIAQTVAEAKAEARESNWREGDVVVIPDTTGIAEYPWPYARGLNGGLYRVPSGDEEADPELIYRDDLYVTRRMRDVEGNDVVVIQLYTPMDGIKEFVMPNSSVISDVELKKTLSSKGVMVPAKKFEAILNYVITATATLQEKRTADIMHAQFGWTDNYRKFIMGEYEITADGYKHATLSNEMKTFAGALGVSGSLAKWQEVFNLYGEPGMEMRAFAAGVAFGAPLMPFTGQNGMLVNMVKSGSGTGKTTVLRMAASVYGNPRPGPERLVSLADDTFNSKMLKLSHYNCLPISFDEITNMKDSETSALVYGINHGAQKDRMKASTNELRSNPGQWETLVLSTSNESVYEKLRRNRDSPDGETMRVIEFPIGYDDGRWTTDFARSMFDLQLRENYGRAGMMYIRLVLNNRKEVKRKLDEMQLLVDKTLGLTQRERIWSAGVSANLTGIFLAIHWKIVAWDFMRIFRAVMAELSKLKAATAPPKDADTGVLQDFLTRHVGNTLVINSATDGRKGYKDLPLKAPVYDLQIRYEPDTHRVYVLVSAFRRDCGKYRISYKETLDELESRGVFLGARNMRISKGMDVDTGSPRVLEFDTSHSDFNLEASLDNLIAETVDEDSGN